MYEKITAQSLQALKIAKKAILENSSHARDFACKSCALSYKTSHTSKQRT
jgi:hypothetical protein